MLAHASLIVGLLAAGVLMIFAAAHAVQSRLESFAQRRLVWVHATAAELVFAVVVVLIGFGWPGGGPDGMPSEAAVLRARPPTTSPDNNFPIAAPRSYDFASTDPLPVLRPAVAGTNRPEATTTGALPVRARDYTSWRLWINLAMGVFLFVWPVGTIFLLVRLCWGHIRLRCHCPDPNGDITARVQATLREVAARIGLKTIPPLRLTRHPVPAVTGLLSPVLLWPASQRGEPDATSTDDAELAAVLAHELAHVVRRDPLWKALGSVLTALLWWHPVTWWTQRQFIRTAELAADEAVVTWGQDGRALARGLVNFATRALAVEPVAVAGDRSGSFLRLRVARLLAMPPPVSSPETRPGQRSVVWGSALLSWFTGTAVVVLTPIGEGGSIMMAGLKFWKTSVIAASFAVLPFGLYQATVGTAAPQERDREVAAQRERGEREGAERDRPREGVRREGERDVDRVSPELIERLRRRTEELEAAIREIREAREAGRADAAERYRNEIRRALGEHIRANELLELRLQLRVLQRQLLAAEEAGQEERAEQLRDRIEEVEQRIRELSAPDRPPIHRAMDELRRRLQELRRRLAEAREAGREREVAEIERAISEAERELHRLELMNELDVARRRIAEAREAGREEEAHAIAERISQLERAIRELQEQTEERRRRETEVQEFAHRLERAVNILRLAGLEDMAELLLHSGRERLERMSQQVRHEEQHERRGEDREREEHEREHD